MDKLRKDEFLVVEWFDAATHDGWMDESEVEDMVADRVVSAGWVQRLTPGEIVLASGYSDGLSRDGTPRRDLINAQIIPRRMIVAVHRVTSFKRGRIGKSTKSAA